MTLIMTGAGGGAVGSHAMLASLLQQAFMERWSLAFLTWRAPQTILCYNLSRNFQVSSFRQAVFIIPMAVFPSPPKNNTKQNHQISHGKSCRLSLIFPFFSLTSYYLQSRRMLLTFPIFRPSTLAPLAIPTCFLHSNHFSPSPFFLLSLFFLFFPFLFFSWLVFALFSLMLLPFSCFLFSFFRFALNFSGEERHGGESFHRTANYTSFV